jgi:ribose transport system permease protein
VNIANASGAGRHRHHPGAAAALAFGLVTAFGMTIIGIPSFIMTLAMMQIANGVSAMLVRGQIAYNYPDLITTLGSGTAFRSRSAIRGQGDVHPHRLDHHRLHASSCSSATSC